jgi:hypothetical protein
MAGSKKVQQKHIPVNFSFIEYINTLNSCISLDMRGAGRLVAVFLAVVLFSTSLSVAFAQTDTSQIPPLSVSTELPLYESGDRVNFSGFIKNLDVNNMIDVTVRIVGPIINGTGSTNIVTVKQVHPLLDGTFADNFVVGGPLWTKKGDYKIIVNYGPQKAESTFFYNGGEEQPTTLPPPKCGEGQIVVNNQCVTPPEEKPTTPVCGTGTVLDPATNTCVVAPPPEKIECAPGEELVNGKCVETAPPTPIGPSCGPGTHAEGNICVPDAKPGEKKGCLIATAAFGTELAPQVQLLREVRDNVLFSTGAGTSFMAGFNEFYYAFSPTVADWERQSPLFKEVVKTTITPMLSTMSILNYVDINSEQEMLGYGIGVILLNIGMYFVAPAIVIVKVKGLLQKRRL